MNIDPKIATLKNKFSQHQPRSLTLAGHCNTISCVIFSPDGQLAASTGDKAVRLWDARAGTILHCLQGHTDNTQSVAFSQCGNYLLSGSNDRTVRLWNIKSGKEEFCFEGHTGKVVAVAFSPDGMAVSCGDDRNLYLWDIERREMKTLLYKNINYKKICFSPDGRMIIGAANGKTIDFETGKEIDNLPGEFPLDLSSDGQRLLASGYVRNVGGKITVDPVIVIDIGSKAVINSLEGHTSWVYGGAFTPDGRFAVTCSRDKTMRIWDLERSQEISCINHIKELSVAAVSPDGAMAMIGSFDNNAYLWDISEITSPNNVISSGRGLIETDWRSLPPEPQPKVFFGHCDYISSVACFPDNRLIASGSLDKTIRLWGIESEENVKVMEGETEVNCLAISPCGQFILSGDRKGAVSLWEIESGKIVAKLTGHTHWINNVDFSPNGKLAVSSSKDGARIWEMPSGREIACCRHKSEVTKAKFFPDGERIITTSNYVGDAYAHIWDALTGDHLRGFKDRGARSPLAISPDGRIILVDGRENSLRLWYSGSGKEVSCLSGHTDYIYDAIFLPDGKRVLSCSNDQNIIMWDVKSGRELTRFTGHSRSIDCIACTPDGRFAITGSDDKTVRLWVLPIEYAASSAI